MKAKINLVECPTINAALESVAGGKIRVSVFCAETGGATYPLGDPANPLRRELSGEYPPDKLPTMIVEAAKYAASRYRGPSQVGPYFDAPALEFFKEEK